MDQSSVGRYPGAALPASYFMVGNSSFSDFLAMAAPDLLPARRLTGAPMSGQAGAATPVTNPHGTTIVAAVFRGGVLIAGDRRATSGNLIAQRDMEKVFVIDDYSAVGIAGAAGVAVEMVRLFAVELQHYEKIEGVPLTLDGKANKLGGMVRGNLEGALRGLAALPLFVGYDLEAADPDRAGRIVSYDVAGGRYEESAGYTAIGSGSLFARTSLKKLHDPLLEVDAAVRVAMEALYDAADDDTATGGPDIVRQIYPVVVTVTAADGAVRMSDEQSGQVAEAVLEGRKQKPGG
ncbi:MAG TPA: proteasome subunit beta [Pseudonocardiaceae bacterium]|jgi:proteasome beta subunit|nr:proteasome subunit beta [Pseudonocardiaceae bacterium]